jgi:hypothetical protein
MFVAFCSVLLVRTCDPDVGSSRGQWQWHPMVS